MTTYLEGFPVQRRLRRNGRGRDWNRWLASALSVANGAIATGSRGRRRGWPAVSALRRGAVALAGLALLAGVLVSGLVGGSSAVADGGVGETPASAVIVVARGDSLWSIAGRLDAGHNRDRRAVIARIAELNGLTGDRVFVGQQLLVPDVWSS